MIDQSVRLPRNFHLVYNTDENKWHLIKEDKESRFSWMPVKTWEETKPTEKDVYLILEAIMEPEEYNAFIEDWNGAFEPNRR